MCGRFRLLVEILNQSFKSHINYILIENYNDIRFLRCNDLAIFDYPVVVNGL
jgi:hypothetical protein